jgi:hypothetical protein
MNIVVGPRPLRHPAILPIIHLVVALWSLLYPLCVIGQYMLTSFMTLAVTDGLN